MRTILTSALLLLPFLATSCGDAKVEAGAMLDKAKAAANDLANQVKDLDLSKLTPDAMIEKGKEFAGNLTTKLSEVKDKASAEELSKSLAPMLDKLVDMKGLLKDKMPAMDDLKKMAGELEKKFAGDNSILEALKPLLEKLKALFA